MIGFFSKKELVTQKDTSKKILNKDQNVNFPKGEIACNQCKLYKGKINPKLKAYGLFKKKILVIGSMPSQSDDEVGKPFNKDSETGKFLHNTFKDVGLDLYKDCLIINACDCYKEKTLTEKDIRCCLYRKERVVQKYKPRYILLLGTEAKKSFYSFDPQRKKYAALPLTSLRGFCVPDRNSNAYIFHSEHPSFVSHYNKDMQSIFKLDLLTFATIVKKKKRPAFINFEENIIPFIKYKEIKSLFQKILQEKPTMIFDYESSSYRYHENKHKVYLVSIQTTDSNTTYVVPLDFPKNANSDSWWNNSKRKKVFGLFKKILEDENIKKVAQNIKHEIQCSHYLLNAEVRNVYHDTMIAAHVINTEDKLTNLKTQGYLRFGQYHYGISDNIIGSDPQELNKFATLPFDVATKYCAIDSKITNKLIEPQINTIHKRKLTRGYKLFLEGVQAFSVIERNGIKINLPLAKRLYGIWGEQINEFKDKILSCKEAKKFNKVKGRQLKFEKKLSDDDLRTLLFDIHGIKSIKQTKTGASESVDNEVLLQYADKSELVSLEMQRRKLDKMRNTYLSQFLLLQVDGFLYPSFNLHLARSLRSCIAKGTPIYAVRDFIKYPNGVPIEKIKKGDFVYSFDKDLKPVIRKVLWAGQTGIKKVIRIHWKGGFHYLQKGYLDLTPEHRVRMVNGKYKEAGDLNIGDHVLACRRKKDKIFFTGNSNGFLEHRFIYKKLIGKLKKVEVIHHKNKIHLDHSISNLKKKTKSEHCKLHAVDTILSPESRKNNIKAVKLNWKLGKYYIPKGEENWNSLNLSKQTCLRVLAEKKGLVAKVKSEYDFGTFKSYLKKHNINPKYIKIRYDRKGKYISKKRLLSLYKKIGISELQKKLGLGYYKLKLLFKQYDIPFERTWGNQFGAFVPNNHIITKIEYINKTVPVYDIEVEGTHNFFANQICTHNSSDSPNFQNIPKRTEEAKEIRQIFISRWGNKGKLAEVDYGSMEVRIIACVTKDGALIAYLVQGGDMHGDWAEILFKCKKKDIDAGIFAKLRYIAKNHWVFPLFYGSFYKSVARSTDIFKIFEELGLDCWCKSQAEWENHLKECEAKFWKQFKGVREWQNKYIDSYKRNGFIKDFAWGFERHGYLTRNKIYNFPIQGPAYHCLQYTINNLWRNNFYNFKSPLCGQIHDALFWDCLKTEFNTIKNKVHYLMTEKIREDNPWIIVPLIDEWSKGDNWANMEDCNYEKITKE